MKAIALRSTHLLAVTVMNGLVYYQTKPKTRLIRLMHESQLQQLEPIKDEGEGSGTHKSPKQHTEPPPISKNTKANTNKGKKMEHQNGNKQ